MMYNKCTKNLIIILLLSDLSFSEWILDFSNEFDENSEDLEFWNKQDRETSKSILSSNFLNFHFKYQFFRRGNPISSGKH